MQHNVLDRFRADDGLLWCAVQAEPNRETYARGHIEEAGVSVWWPHYATIVTRRIGTVDRRLPVLRGLFAGYLLAGVDDPSQTIAIRSTKGVAALVSGPDGRALFIVPEEVAAWRRKAINAEGLFETPEWATATVRASYKAGDRVKIASGSSFAGFLGAVARIKGSAVTVDLERDIFGRPVSVTVDACQLERA